MTIQWPEPVEWIATDSEPAGNGIVVKMQPFYQGKRYCSPRDGFRFLVTHSCATFQDGRVRLNGRAQAVPEGLAELAHWKVTNILAPDLEIGVTTQGYALLGPRQSPDSARRLVLYLEGPNAGDLLLASHSTPVTEWPDRLDRLINAWLRWVGWSIPSARLRLWAATLPADRADVPECIDGVPCPLQLKAEGIRLYPPHPQGTTRYGDTGLLYPDAVELFSAAQKAQDRLPDDLRMMSQVWVSPLQSRHAVLMIPFDEMMIAFPTQAGAMEESGRRGLKVLMARMLPTS